jgi:hypothetical protein
MLVACWLAVLFVELLVIHAELVMRLSTPVAAAIVNYNSAFTINTIICNILIPLSL